MSELDISWNYAELPELKRKLKKMMDEAEPIKKRIELIEEEKLKKSNLGYVGNCFVFVNSYGRGGTWNLYRKIVGVTSFGEFKVISAQKDCYGEIEIKQDTISHHLLGGRISNVEFNAQFNGLVKELLVSGNKDFGKVIGRKGAKVVLESKYKR